MKPHALLCIYSKYILGIHLIFSVYIHIYVYTYFYTISLYIQLLLPTFPWISSPRLRQDPALSVPPSDWWV